jgi:hypothetical protein
MMVIGRDMLSRAETVTVAAVVARAPTFVEARGINAAFLFDPAQSCRRAVTLDRKCSRQSRRIIRPRRYER